MPAINWFPGHMNKARREIKKAMGKVELVIEVLDARMPHSSENPLVEGLRGDTPCIKVLNKRDLADPAVTRLWMEHFKAREGTWAITNERGKPKVSQQILKLGRRLMPKDRNMSRPILAMILGVPNVGKSTLLNTFVGRGLADVGNKPAVTKRQQRVEVGREYILLDTPGFLWPRLDPPECGMRLAALASIPDHVVSYEEIGPFVAAETLRLYPQALVARFKLKELPTTPEELVETIGRKRGCMQKGGVVNLPQACEVLVKELRMGKLGPISLERPGELG
ncbi:MAG: ribosome biogenesis GTPase YlqF [Myxococcota bacterium]|nr:ribosome biogenesis GTPase YlqF [Myxococcota bacterium]